MHRTKITKLALGRALEVLRGKLKQKEVEERTHGMTAADSGLPPRHIRASQISDYENGKVIPSLENLVCLLAAFNDDEDVDFCQFHKILEAVIEGRIPVREKLLEDFVNEPMVDDVKEIFDNLSERLLKQEEAFGEVAELRRRLEEQEAQILKLYALLEERSHDGREGSGTG